MNKQGKQKETGRNRKKREEPEKQVEKKNKIERNWMILKETGRNSTFCTFCIAWC